MYSSTANTAALSHLHALGQLRLFDVVNVQLRHLYVGRMTCGAPLRFNDVTSSTGHIYCLEYKF
jgi:hypothetical protein